MYLTSSRLRLQQLLGRTLKTGSLTSSHVKRATFSGTVDCSTGSFTVKYSPSGFPSLRLQHYGDPKTNHGESGLSANAFVKGVAGGRGGFHGVRAWKAAY